MYVDSHGLAVHLGARIGRGGEGDVFEVSRPGLVAKLLHPPSRTQVRRAKLRAMVLWVPEDPTQSLGHPTLCWPLELLFERSALVGFLMPRLDVRACLPLHRFLFPPLYPARFHWGLQLEIAANLAAGLAAVHAKGYVVGDLNFRNVLVARSCLITFVDCDSMQVTDPASGRVLRCPVGMPEYLAAELQGVALDTVDRTEASDSFAFAVMACQLLLTGAHPFAGGHAATREQNILANDCFLLSGNVPAGTPPPALLPPPLLDLLLRCFRDGHRKPPARPRLQEFAEVLARSRGQVASCGVFPSRHVFSSHLVSCPWCDQLRLRIDPYRAGASPAGAPARARTAAGSPRAHPPLGGAPPAVSGSHASAPPAWASQVSSGPVGIQTPVPAGPVHPPASAPSAGGQAPAPSGWVAPAASAPPAGGQAPAPGGPVPLAASTPLTWGQAPAPAGWVLTRAASGPPAGGHALPPVAWTPRVASGRPGPTTGRPWLPRRLQLAGIATLASMALLLLMIYSPAAVPAAPSQAVPGKGILASSAFSRSAAKARLAQKGKLPAIPHARRTVGIAAAAPPARAFKRPGAWKDGAVGASFPAPPGSSRSSEVGTVEGAPAQLPTAAPSPRPEWVGEPPASGEADVPPAAQVPPVVQVPPVAPVLPTGQVPPTARVPPVAPMSPMAQVPPVARVPPIAEVSPGAQVPPVPPDRSLPSVAVDQRPATERELQDCVGAGWCDPSPERESCLAGRPPPAGGPAVCVSWNDAVAFCAREGKRLPSRSEWAASRPARAARGAPREWVREGVMAEAAGGTALVPFTHDHREADLGFRCASH
jgi:hypothetical protein